MRIKHPRRHDPGHLAFVRSLPCVVCQDDIHTEAAHIRFGSPQAAKRWTGMGEKPDDAWTVPLCNRHHDEQHRGGEVDFWELHKIDPLRVAAFLAVHSGDHEAGEMVVRNARR